MLTVLARFPMTNAMLTKTDSSLYKTRSLRVANFYVEAENQALPLLAFGRWSVFFHTFGASLLRLPFF